MFRLTDSRLFWDVVTVGGGIGASCLAWLLICEGGRLAGYRAFGDRVIGYTLMIAAVPAWLFALKGLSALVEKHAPPRARGE
jgi:hypothetical protein